MSNPMENMTFEQLVATFGEATAKQMMAQMSANKGGGNSAPFTFVKKIATHGSELGNFGEFAINVKTEKGEDGKRTVVDAGQNLGTAFDFIIVNVSYRYRKWDEVKGRTLNSNIFENLEGIKTAVDAYSGMPLPADKQAKKDAGWKLVRINAGLIRGSKKDAWQPAIWETDGMMYFTLGEVINNRPNKGWLDSIVHVQTKLDSKGATQFSVIDTAKSSCSDLPSDLFTNTGTKDMIGDITGKMTEWRESNQYKGDAGTSVKGSGASHGAPGTDSEGEPDW